MNKYDAIKRKLDMEGVSTDNFSEVGRLLNTYFSKCEEYFKEEGNWWGDKFWGVDIKTRIGENNLGKLIMQVRDELRDGGVLNYEN